MTSTISSLSADNPRLELTIPAGLNYEKAAFRWWHPDTAMNSDLCGVLVLVPGSNGDGRGLVADPFWQDFARQHRLALIGCYFTDHPRADKQIEIEGYARASHGSGQALLDAQFLLAKQAHHPELGTAPFLLWGHSAGGQFNYELACWKPDRVRAFVVNKGGYYFTHLAPAATRNTPGIFFIGAKDVEFRIHSIKGIFAVNVQAGARWKLIVEEEAGHELGQTREYAVAFFKEVLSGNACDR